MNNVKQHFRPDEEPFIDELTGQIATAENQYRPVLTAFLNPRQAYIAQTLVNRNDNVHAQLAGGHVDAEMQRLLIFPDYFTPTDKDFEIQLLAVDYPTKFAELHHRQIMGTLLGEGLDRSSFGDIITDGNGDWQVAMTSQMAEYVRRQVDHVGRIKVRWLPAGDHPLVAHDDWESMTTTVSSLRLDTVIAGAFHYSRNRAKQLVERQLAQVNWETMDRPDYSLVMHDIISVRHAGRIRVDDLGPVTRKGKQRITLSVIHA